MGNVQQLDQVSEAAEETALRESFELAVETHRRRIFRYLLASSRDLDTAETLTQECFLKAYRNWPGFRGDSGVSTWLMRIAINLQRDHWRNRRIQFWQQTRRNGIDVYDAGQSLPSSQSSPEDQLSAREQVARVWTAVEHLSEKQRTVFLLRYVEDFPYRDIANATGMHEAAVKSHLSRALRRVRMELTGDCREANNRLQPEKDGGTEAAELTRAGATDAERQSLPNPFHPAGRAPHTKNR
jgi:RNA polymerase sigma-70 factor, ECF subfamily